ncbi:hypothetical protein L6452_25675 [Arctium lappa]|uniref:Uncharacterized protein n=1 Tax=Arctium lappa TaxID=4217 RepID=A0ACB9ABW2_ARCLA|nr:hypothetical protein L6452_25675 [Arctium lappa]
MGCGKSKHAVVTSTSVVKSMRSDGGKETKTTKTVTDKGDSSLVHVETKSLVVEDSKKETVTTKIEPPADNNVVGTKNVAPTSVDNDAGARKVPEAPTSGDNNVGATKVADAPTLVDNDVGATKVADAPTSVDNNVGATKTAETGKIKDCSPKDINDSKNRDVASKDIVGVTEVVKEDEQKNESNLKDNHEANVAPTRDEKIKVSDNEAKTEVAVEAKATEVVEENAKVTDSKEEEEEAKGETIDKKHAKTIDDSSNPDKNIMKVEDRKDVAPAEESTKVETKKEEDVEVIGADIVNTETSLAAEPEKAPDAKEASGQDDKTFLGQFTMKFQHCENFFVAREAHTL